MVSICSVKHLFHDNTTVTRQISAVRKVPESVIKRTFVGPLTKSTRQEPGELRNHLREAGLGVWATADIHTHTCTRTHARLCLEVFNETLNLSTKRGAG